MWCTTGRFSPYASTKKGVRALESLRLAYPYGGNLALEMAAPLADLPRYPLATFPCTRASLSTTTRDGPPRCRPP
jgi:hypothetical protein